MQIQAPYRAAKNRDETSFSIARDLSLHVFDSLPETLEWKGKTFLKKKEFHITLVHAPVILMEQLIQVFNRFVARTSVELERFENEFRSQKKEANETIVIRCVATNLIELFQEINTTLSIDLPLQPAHVTLYSIDENVGIAIDSVTEMELLPRVELLGLGSVFYTFQCGV